MKCRRGWSAVHIFLNIIPVVMGCIIIANSVQQLSYSIHMTPIWASVVLLVSGILLIVLGIFGYCIQRRGFNPWMVSSFLLLFLVLIALFSISAGTYTYWYTVYAGLQKELLSNDGIPLASRGLYYSIWAGYVGLWYQGGCSGAMLCDDPTAEGCEELLGGSGMGRRRQLLLPPDGLRVEGWPPSIRRRTSIEQSMDSMDPPGGSGMDDGNMGPTTGVDGMDRTMAPGGGDDGDREQGMVGDTTEAATEQPGMTEGRDDSGDMQDDSGNGSGPSEGEMGDGEMDDGTEEEMAEDVSTRPKLGQIYCDDESIEEKMQMRAAEDRKVVFMSFDDCIEYAEHISEGEELVYVDDDLKMDCNKRPDSRTGREMREFGMDGSSDAYNGVGEISPTVTLTTCDFSPSGHRCAIGFTYMVLDYSKWDNLDLSSSSSSERGEDDDDMYIEGEPPVSTTTGPGGLQVRSYDKPVSVTLGQGKKSAESSSQSSKPRGAAQDHSGDYTNGVYIRNGSKCDKYYWSQTKDSITISVIVPKHTKGKDIKAITVERDNELRVDLAGDDSYFSGHLEFPVKMDDPEDDISWEMKDVTDGCHRVVEISLRKTAPLLPGLVMWWSDAIKDGGAAVDVTALPDRRKASNAKQVQEAWNEALEAFKEKRKQPQEKFYPFVNIARRLQSIEIRVYPRPEAFVSIGFKGSLEEERWQITKDGARIIKRITDSSPFSEFNPEPSSSDVKEVLELVREHSRFPVLLRGALA
ncbi:hypothetical protein FOZ61_002999 [Perkinsus olseni]|uniref:CS domain-containing protein n=1 Tax=Perkinsus olseni TaxID=32597 RepID=A0A7J6MDX3_PEROL|nr:hypothetical protein FOZ61_002999 [Perkinsus olseni]